MTFTTVQNGLLAADLNRSHVAQRTQGGRSLSYIEGWHAIAEANRIFGFGGWSSETFDLRMVSEHQRRLKSGDGWAVSYVARVRVRVGDVIREGTGTGHGKDLDLGMAHESAVKEAETDARKRALMTFGNQFGLALYDKTQANVSDDEPVSLPAKAPEPKEPPRAPAKAPVPAADDKSKLASTLAKMENSMANKISAASSEEVLRNALIELAVVISPIALNEWSQTQKAAGTRKRLSPGDGARLDHEYVKRRDAIAKFEAAKADPARDVEFGRASAA